jgi:conjugal transfer pilus assembly protein TraB
MKIETNPAWVKKIQRWHLILGVVGIIVFIWGLLALVDSKKPTVSGTENKPTDFASPLNNVNTEAVFMEKAERQVLAAQKAAEEAKKQVALSEASQKNALGEEKDQRAQLLERINELEKQIQTQSITPVSPPVEGQQTGVTSESEQAPAIRVDTLNLSANTTEIQPVKNPDTYVPSGTFAKAVMLGGADASAAVTSQSNPNPMLFRIVDNGTLPNNRKSHLKDCIVTAAVSGDISSERGHIRLETLSCTKDNDAIVDFKVKGTVFGPEGKNGIRGQTLWREGALLQRAFAAGALSGLANGLSQRYTTASISPLGATENVNSNGMWGFGAARGASNAMNKLADYNIKRAEQYHPVIQLSAGTEVDIVFLEGFFLDGSKESENQKTNDASLLPHPAQAMQPVLPANTPPALPLSDKQIQRLKEHQKDFTQKQPDFIASPRSSDDE